MNKTITANIGGIVFHIDVEAFDKLQHYLAAISKYFDKSEGKDEIMSDIETRIAELFKERSSNQEQVIRMEDVDAVIKIMGEPEQYADPDAQEEADFEPKGRKSSSSYHNRRIFRDPDNAQVAGVCAGIGYYFGITPAWIRLFFILAFLGWGSGILIYVILWLIIPEAKTTAEKLEMKGEPVNIDNIGKTIDEELNKVKEQFNKFASKTSKRGDFANFLDQLFGFITKILTELLKFIGKLLHVLFRVVLKLLGIAFVLAGIVLLVFLIASMFDTTSVLSVTSEGFHYYSLQQLFYYLSASSTHWTMMIIAGILFIGIPLLTVIYSGIKLLFPHQTPINGKGIGITLFTLWLIGLVIAIILVFQIGMEFRNEARVDENIELEQPQGQVFYLDVNEELFADELDDTFDDKFIFQYRTDHGTIQMLRFDNLLFQKEGKEHFLGMARLNILKSNNGKFRMELKKMAKGLTHRQAESRARSIEYHFEQNDSILLLDPVFTMNNSETEFRDQWLKIELYIPENTIVDLSDPTGRMVYNLGNMSNKWLRKAGYWDWEMEGHKWIMLRDGLTCLDCKVSSEPLLDSAQLKLIKNVGL